MPLTREEMADIDRMLSRMDRKARDRQWERWIGVLNIPLSFAFAAWSFWLAAKAWGLILPPDSDPQVSPLDLVFAVTGGMGVVATSILGFGGLLSGVTTLGTLPDWWNRGRREHLLVRMARCWLETQEPASPDDAQGRAVGEASEGE